MLVAMLGCGCQAQVVDYSLDSMKVVNAEWRVDSLDGLTLKRYHFGEGSLFCSAQYFCLMEIPAGSARRLAFAGDSAAAEVSAFGERSGAVAAVNGSYFNMDSGTPICYLRIEGEAIGENTPSEADSLNRKYYQYATLALKDGRPSFLVPDSNRRWEEKLADSNIMTAGPMLLRNGQEVEQRDDRTFVTHRHNRTALGVKADGTTLILVADGRFRHKAEGLSLPELERVMRWLGCTDAINLDGGGSSTMYIQGKSDNGVVNHPSDNQTFDHRGERKVANAIVVL